MAEATEPQVYQITATNSMGDKLVSYVLPEARAAVVRNMSSEYGKLEIVGMQMDELPEGVTFGGAPAAETPAE